MMEAMGLIGVLSIFIFGGISTLFIIFYQEGQTKDKEDDKRLHR